VTDDRRPVDGLLVVDKPLNWTSHDVVARIRRLAGQRRVGHAGTLDPLATGVLVVGIGQGTRVLSYLDKDRKTYAAVVRLGQSTSTYDAAGEITAESDIAGISVDAIEEALERFRGSFQQVPPMFSAIKVAGKPLYRYAREGVELDRAPRSVTVTSLRVLAFEPPLVRLEVESSAGFYVRSLAHDVGDALGCGAHLAGLRRTRSGRFSTVDACALDDIEIAAASGGLPALLKPLDTPLLAQPAVILSVDSVVSVTQGRFLETTRWKPLGLGDLCRAYSAEGELIGILRLSDDDRAQPVKVFPEGRRGPQIEHE
jgi:tRNA pseudouridine55 synthase